MNVKHNIICNIPTEIQQLLDNNKLTRKHVLQIDTHTNRMLIIDLIVAGHNPSKFRLTKKDYNTVIDKYGNTIGHLAAIFSSISGWKIRKGLVANNLGQTPEEVYKVVQHIAKTITKED